MKIKTRFAPSPTGSLHLGGLRTALYSYALAKSNKGVFVLRIEDTDKKREIRKGKEKIIEILAKFDIKWDEYYIQSERLDLYSKAAEKLIKDGNAFYCQCGAKNARKEGYSSELRDPCRNKSYKSGAIKLMIPDNGEVSFVDYVLGKEIRWDVSTVADTTLLKSDGFPTYHLAAVVDDHDTGVTHVLRGHDWMPSTPVHLLVYKFLGYTPPKIGHLTDILDPEGGKLSKRKGSVSCEGLLNEGYLPEALLNFIVLLGWAPKDNRELYTLDEFVKDFDPKGFQKANPVFNKEKLDWFNGIYLRKMTDIKLTEVLNEFYNKKLNAELVGQTIPLVKDRINKLTDYWEMAGFFFEERVADEKLFGSNKKEHLNLALESVNGVSDWTDENLEKKLQSGIKTNNFKTGDFFMDLRIAVTGRKFTPPITDSIIILGKQKTLDRIKKYI